MLCWGTLGTVQAEFSEAVDSYEWSLPSGTSALNQAGPGLYQLSLQGMNGCQNEYVLSLGMLPPIATGLEDRNPNARMAWWCWKSQNKSMDSPGTSGGVHPPSGEFDGGRAVCGHGDLGLLHRNRYSVCRVVAEPSADALPSNASACALDLPFVLEWPAQAQDAVGSWQWTVNARAPTPSATA